MYQISVSMLETISCTTCWKLIHSIHYAIYPSRQPYREANEIVHCTEKEEAKLTWPCTHKGNLHQVSSSGLVTPWPVLYSRQGREGLTSQDESPVFNSKTPESAWPAQVARITNRKWLKGHWRECPVLTILNTWVFLVNLNPWTLAGQSCHHSGEGKSLPSGVNALEYWPFWFSISDKSWHRGLDP